MSQQSFRNHRKFYAPHHFVFYPLSLALIIFALWMGFEHKERHFEWVTIGLAIVLIAWLSAMTRHYALKLQDRIIRTEMRFRYYVLTQKRFEPLEALLTFRQLAALRFASDEELPALIERAIAENLPSKEIKRSIANWLPDHMRV